MYDMLSMRNSVLGKLFPSNDEVRELQDNARALAKSIVAGVGPDAPTVTHENGSKESLCLYALDVIPHTLAHTVSDPVVECISDFLAGEDEGNLIYLASAMTAVLEEIDENEHFALLKVGEVLADGERKYGADTNWHGIPAKQHLRHALAHRFAHLAGDRSEGEIGHLTRTACRIAFAIDVTCREA